MKKKIESEQYITDELISSDEWDNFDYRIREEIESYKQVFHTGQSLNWETSLVGSSYLLYAEKLLRQKGQWRGVGDIKELQTLISKYDDLKIFLLTLRIATMTYREGLIPMLVREGISRIDGRSEGGKVPKECAMVKEAMIETQSEIKAKDAFSLWLHFARQHYGFAHSQKIGEWDIFFMIDLKGLNENEIPGNDAARRGKLFQIFRNDDKTLKGIKLPTFRQYFSEIKKIMSK